MSALLIAEVGSVHDGSFGNATRLTDVAADCGADCVKFQTHIAAAETLSNAPMPPYFKGEPRYEYFERTAFTEEQWRRLRDHCRERGVEFLSSPFSVEAVQVLERVGVERYKVPSGEVTNLPLLEAIGATGRAVLLSSGMSSWAELDVAINTILRYRSRLTVLQCTSEYPCPPEHVGLNVMVEMRERYQLPVGLSDHTLTNHAAFAAVVLGASVIEKHFTLSRLMYGSDARHSAEPGEFAELVRGIRAIETMRASRVDKDDLRPFKEMKQVFEKSLVTLVDIPAGAVITREMIGVKKPGTGLPPSRLPDVVGRRAARAIPADELLREDHLA
ncbi:MAG: N-acetylneuraminate synthase family protein [Planctomycetes bacterium]|nr:N-acetylneuraminate synthase family protein [Planctomycetota bacterium]